MFYRVCLVRAHVPGVFEVGPEIATAVNAYVTAALGRGLPIDDELVDDLCRQFGWHDCEIEEDTIYAEPEHK